MKAILRAKEHHLHELLPSRLLDRHDKVAGPLPSQSQYEEEGGSSVTIRRLSWLFPIPLRPCRHRQHCSKSRRPCDGMETSFLPSKSIDLWVLLWNDEILLLGQENVLKKKNGQVTRCILAFFLDKILPFGSLHCRSSTRPAAHRGRARPRSPREFVRQSLPRQLRHHR